MFAISINLNELNATVKGPKLVVHGKGGWIANKRLDKQPRFDLAIKPLASP